MKRKTFLLIAAIIALAVGVFALFFPEILLISKGVEIHAGTLVWVRETGGLLLGVGIIAFMICNHEATKTLKALLLGNFFIQVALFAIEFIALNQNIITKISGVAPNLIIHIILALGFAYYWYNMKLENKEKS